jgi:hypothetical protein
MKGLILSVVSFLMAVCMAKPVKPVPPPLEMPVSEAALAIKGNSTFSRSLVIIILRWELSRELTGIALNSGKGWDPP